MSMHDDIEKVLVSEEQLKAKVAELGARSAKTMRAGTSSLFPS